MAQAPETKLKNATDDVAAQEKEHVMRPAAAGERVAHAATAAGADFAEDAMRDTAHAASTMWHAGAEASRESAATGSDAARRMLFEAITAHGRLLEHAAEHYESVGRRLADTARETAADLRALAMPAVAVAERSHEIQDGIAGVVCNMLQTNMRAAQRWLRFGDADTMFDLQRQFMRDCMDSVMQGAGTLIRAARDATEPMQVGRNEQYWRDGDRLVVGDVMRRQVRLAAPDDTVQQTTRLMRDEATDVVPVGENDRLVGVVTEHDLASRLIAEGKDPARTKVRDVMSRDVRCVYQDEALDRVASDMTEHHVHRLPVVDRERRVIGVVSLRDVARRTRGGFGESARRAAE